MKFSTPIPTPSSTMLRSKSAAPAPCNSAAPSPPRCSKRPASSIPRPSPRSSKNPAPTCATPTTSTTFCKPSFSFLPQLYPILNRGVILTLSGAKRKDPTTAPISHAAPAFSISNRFCRHPMRLHRYPIGWGRSSPAGCTTWSKPAAPSSPSLADREFWVASEKAKAFTSIYVDVSFSPEPPDLHSSISTPHPSPEAILDRALLGWMQHLGPVTTQELFDLFSVTQTPILSHLRND